MLGRWLRRWLGRAVVLVLAWVVLLAVAGEIAGRRVAVRLQSALRTALGAEVRLGGVDLGLVRGRFELAELEITRRELGAMRLAIHQAHLDTAPLGWALLERDRATALSLRGVTAELSSWAVLSPPPGRALQFQVDRYEFRDVTLVLAPTLLAPSLGAITVIVERADGGATTLRSAASWLLSLRHLDARVHLPGGASATLRYRGAGPGRAGTLTIASSLMRNESSIPLSLPAIPEQVDGVAGEQAALRDLGRQIGREISKNKAAQLFDRLLR
jgi:hypothetical protein